MYRYNTDVDKIFKALADKNRRLILTLLRESELSVSAILKHLNIGQATLSSHLAILRKAKLVSYRISGRERIYSLESQVWEMFVSEINKFATNTKIINQIEEIKMRGSS